MARSISLPDRSCDYNALDPLIALLLLAGAPSARNGLSRPLLRYLVIRRDPPPGSPAHGHCYTISTITVTVTEPFTAIVQDRALGQRIFVHRRRRRTPRRRRLLRSALGAAGPDSVSHWRRERPRCSFWTCGPASTERDRGSGGRNTAHRRVRLRPRVPSRCTHPPYHSNLTS